MHCAEYFTEKTINLLTNVPTFTSQSRPWRQKPLCINYLLIYCNYETERKREPILLLQKDGSWRQCSVFCCRDDSTQCWLDMESDPAHHTLIIREECLRLTALTCLINILIMCFLSVCHTAVLRISSEYLQESHLIWFLYYSVFFVLLDLKITRGALIYI